MNFLALSQAPPAFAMKSESEAPTATAPASMPARDAGPSRKPTRTGAKIATEPGSTIWLSAAFVAMSTIAVPSGSALPSRRPGISLNCRMISSMIDWAARPTAVIVDAPTA